ncbi:GALAK [Linum grandiflorum]
MAEASWPSEAEVNQIKNVVSSISGRDPSEVRVVVSPYRICPLGAHIDHQGGSVSAMTINRGILLGFVPSHDTKVVLRSGQFEGEVHFSVDEIQQPLHSSKQHANHTTDSSNHQEDSQWGKFARGAVFALQKTGYSLTRGITGFICGSEGLDSAGLSSSAAAGVAYMLAFESANNLTMSPVENIEFDRLIENEYLGLKNGILDQSAILLSSRGCLTYMNCKTKEHKLVRPFKSQRDGESDLQKSFKILVAFSGLRKALTSGSGYNRRVSECQEAARVLLKYDPFLTCWNIIEQKAYEIHKDKLEGDLAKRAEHYFSENKRVNKGIEAWMSGDLEEFGKLISGSGLSSIKNYECGCEALIQLYEIVVKAPGVYGGRFSGAGFRGCCIALVRPHLAHEAAAFVKSEYAKAQPHLASQLNPDATVLICEPADSARIIISSSFAALS